MPDYIDNLDGRTYYALAYPNGQLVALDSASGGYPYPASTFRSAALWDSPSKALKYPAAEENFSLVEIVLSVTEIEPPMEVLTTSELLRKLDEFCGYHEGALDDSRVELIRAEALKRADELELDSAH